MAVAAQLPAGQRVPENLTPPDTDESAVQEPTADIEPSAKQQPYAGNVDQNQNAAFTEFDQLAVQPFQATQYLADIRIHTSAELLETLQRVEQLTTINSAQPKAAHPVMFLLHGDEARSLL